MLIDVVLYLLTVELYMQLENKSVCLIFDIGWKYIYIYIYISFCSVEPFVGLPEPVAFLSVCVSLIAIHCGLRG